MPTTKATKKETAKKETAKKVSKKTSKKNNIPENNLKGYFINHSTYSQDELEKMPFTESVFYQTIDDSKEYSWDEILPGELFFTWQEMTKEQKELYGLKFTQHPNIRINPTVINIGTSLEPKFTMCNTLLMTWDDKAKEIKYLIACFDPKEQGTTKLYKGKLVFPKNEIVN